MQTIQDVMTRTVYTIESTASVREAARLMLEHDVGFLPVIHEGVSAGVITDRDVAVRVVAENRDPDTTYVGAVLSAESPNEQMSAGVATLPEETSIDEAVSYMDARQVRRVTVHDKQYRIVGVISRADLATTTASSQA
jgi:CBS domain-containing protein